MWIPIEYRTGDNRRHCGYRGDNISALNAFLFPSYKGDNRAFRAQLELQPNPWCRSVGRSASRQADLPASLSAGRPRTGRRSTYRSEQPKYLLPIIPEALEPPRGSQGAFARFFRSNDIRGETGCAWNLFTWSFSPSSTRYRAVAYAFFCFAVDAYNAPRSEAKLHTRQFSSR